MNPGCFTVTTSWDLFKSKRCMNLIRMTWSLTMFSSWIPTIVCTFGLARALDEMRRMTLSNLSRYLLSLLYISLSSSFFFSFSEWPALLQRCLSLLFSVFVWMEFRVDNLYWPIFERSKIRSVPWKATGPWCSRSTLPRGFFFSGFLPFHKNQRVR